MERLKSGGRPKSTMWKTLVNRNVDQVADWRERFKRTKYPFFQSYIPDVRALGDRLVVIAR